MSTVLPNPFLLSQAKASVGNGSTVPELNMDIPADRVAGEASRRVAARTATATSERTDVTAGRDRQPFLNSRGGVESRHALSFTLAPQAAPSADVTVRPAGVAPGPREATIQHPDFTVGAMSAAMIDVEPLETMLSALFVVADESTARRAFGPGDIMARLEHDLETAIADINANDRFMRRLPAFLANPSPEFLNSIPKPVTGLRDQSLLSGFDHQSDMRLPGRRYSPQAVRGGAPA